MKASQAAWKKNLKKGGRAYLTPSYLSNGHWMVRRSALPPGLHAQFLSAASAIEAFVGTKGGFYVKDEGDKFCENVLNIRGIATEWIVTDVSIGSGRLLVPVLEADRKRGQLVAIMEDYIDLLDIEVGQIVHGAVDSLFSDAVDDWTWGIMPIRFNDADLKTIVGLL